MKMTLRFVVAGTGWVAGEYLKAIYDRQDAEVYGVFSNNAEYAKARLAELGIQARLFTRYEEVVQDPQVDAIVLCSQPDVRPEQAVQAAQNGKHLVIEKPMAMNKAELWRMEDALKKHPVTTVVSFVLRWNPSFNNTKALIDDDAIGRVFMSQIDYWHHVGPQYGQYRWSRTKETGGSSMRPPAAMRSMRSVILPGKWRKCLHTAVRPGRIRNMNSIRMRLPSSR
jgi:predicted dehydrogenase